MTTVSGKAGILLVEDDPLFAEVLSQQLKKEGYSVTGIAESQEEAIHILKKKGTDLALVDIGLKGPEDGINTARELLRIKEIPIIYLTGRSLADSLFRIKDTTPAAFLQKPIRPEEVLAQIELVLHAVERSIQNSISSTFDMLFVPSDKGLTRLNVDEILCVRADAHYAKVVLEPESFARMFPGKPYAPLTIYVPMGTLLKELPPYFFKLSKSEVINLRKVAFIGKSGLSIGGQEKTIPDGKRADLLSRLRIVKRRRNDGKPDDL